MPGPLSYEALITTSQFNAGLDAMERRILGVTNVVVKQGNVIDREFARMGQLAAGYFSFQALAGLPAQIARVRGEFQNLEVSFRTLLGNKEKADELLAKATELAAKTPFSLRDVGQGAKQLLAYGFGAEQIIPTLSKLGDISAGTGDDLNHLILVYGTLRAQGRAYQRDIQQFTSVGVPLLEALSTTLGVSVSKVNELVTAGKVGFPEVERAITSLTKKGSMFGGLQDAQSKTINGLISNLGDAYDRMLNDIGRANEGIISDSVKGVTGVVENYQDVIDIIKVVVATYGGYRAALLLVNAAEKERAAINALKAASIDPTAANAAANLASLRAEVSALAAKKTEVLAVASAQAAAVRVAQTQLTAAQAAATAGASLIDASKRAALAKQVEVAQNNLLAAQETASISRKRAIAAASDFYNAKAALTATATTAQGVAEVRLTTFQAIRATVVQRLAAAEATLTSTMLANPYVFIGTAIAALVGGYFALRKETLEVKTAQELLAGTNREIISKYREQAGEVRSLIDIIKNQNVAESERINAYNKLKEIAPDVVRGLDFQAAKTADLTKATNEYLVSLERKIRLESQQGKFKEAIDQDIAATEQLEKAQLNYINRTKQAKEKGGGGVVTGLDAKAGQSDSGFTLGVALNDLEKATAAKRKSEQTLADFRKNTEAILSGASDKNSITARLAELEQLKSAIKNKLSPAYKDAEDQIKSLTKQRDALTAAEQKGQVVTAKTKGQIDEEIKALKEKQDEQNDPAGFKVIQKQIDSLEAQRRRITGELTKDQKRAIKEADKVGPFGSLSYWDNISKKAQEIIDKTPGADTEKLAKQTQIRNDADAKAEEIRKQTAVKSFDDELAEKKARYELFQKYITAYGQTAADAQFSELRQSGQTYVDYLNEQIRLLEKKRQNGVLSDKEAANLGNLLTERSDATGQKSAIDAFRDSLTKAKDEAASLTDYLTALQQKQAQLNPNDESKNGIDKRQALAEELTATQRELQGQLTQFLQSYANSSEQQLAIQRSFADKRTAVERRYNGQRTAEYQAAMALINTAEAEELQNLQRRKLEESAAYKQTTKVILEEGQKGLAIQIANQRQVVAAAKQIGGANSEVFKQEQQKLNQLTKQYSSNQISEFNQYAQLVGEFGQALSELGGDAAQTGNNLMAFAGAAQQLSGVFKEGLSTTELYQQGIQGLITVFTAIASAAAQRKQAESDYYNSLIAQQQQYNLLLNEQIGLRTKSQSNVFVRDFMGELNDGFKKYDDARAKYEESLKKLSEGRAKSGLKSEIDGASALKLIGGAAATGAAIGSIIPGIGTAVGALGGAIVGGLTALFGGAKKTASEFGNILELYPNLIQKSADGVDELNTSLAESLIQQNLVDDSTKALLQSTIEWQKQMEEARQAIKGIVGELAGALGNDLRDGLVTAFKDGTSAAEAFGNSVEKILEDLVTKMLFQQAFGKLFDQLEKDLADSLGGENGDRNVIDDFQRFTDKSKEATELYNQWLTSFQQAAKASGFDVLQPTNGGSATKANTALSGAVKGVSEETASVLSGTLNAIRITQADTNIVIRQQLVHLSEIAVNSRYNRYLESIDDSLREIKRDSLRSKGGG